MPSSVAYIGLRGPQPTHGHGGPRRLAHAILNDFLGFGVEPIAASAFMADVVAKLPPEIELTGEQVASWVNDRLVLGCLPSRSDAAR